MPNKLNKLIAILAVISLPILASAQLEVTDTFFRRVLDLVQQILIPLAFTLALLFFFWGVAKYIWSEGQGKAEGKQIMIWGVIGLFVMSSVWGLVSFLQDEFLVSKETQGRIPTISK